MAGAHVLNFSPERSIDYIIGAIKADVDINMLTGWYANPWDSRVQVDPSDHFLKAMRLLDARPNPEKEFEARHWYGEHLAHSKRFDQAIEQFGICAKLRPNDNELRLTLARLYHLNGQHEESRELYGELAGLPDATLIARLGNHYHAMAENLHQMIH